MAAPKPPKKKAPPVQISQTRQLSSKRKQELEKFFSGLNALEDFSSGKITQLPAKAISDDFMKILKASSFLLLYNYIEGCVLHSFSSIYDEIRSSNISYAQLRSEFRRIWIEYQTKSLLSDPKSSHNSYNEVASRMVNDILEEASISLSRKALPFSGNLNDEKIKDVCQKHGIKLSSKLLAVEETLETVMSQRNALAHGNISFGECGREYVVSDLERMKQSALAYMELVISGIESFVASKRYLST